MIVRALKYNMQGLGVVKMVRLISNIKKLKSSLFFKILLYFLSLVIPIIIIGFVSYKYSEKELMRDFSSKIMLNLKSSINNIDTDLKTSQEISMNFFYDDTVISSLKPLKDMNKDEERTAFKIPKILSRNQYLLNNFVDSLYVYVDDKFIYSEDGRNEMEDFFGKFNKYELYDTKFWVNLLESDDYFTILTPSKIEKNLKPCGYVIPTVSKTVVNGYSAVMVVNISADTINKIIRKNTILPSTNFIVLDSDNRVIVNGIDKTKDSKTVEEIAKKFDKEMEKSQQVDINGNAYLLTYERSDNYGWKYFMITPMSEFSKRASNVLNLTLILCITLSVMGVLFSFIFARNIYNPIKKIRDILSSNDQVSTCSNKGIVQDINDFQIIGQGINYLLEHEKDFKNKNSILIIEYINSSLIYLIKGEKLDKLQTLHKILGENFKFNKNSFMCCNVMFDFKEAFYKDVQDIERISILGGLKKVVQYSMEEFVSAYTVELRHNIFVCVLNVDGEKDKDNVLKAAQNILHCFEYDSQYCKISIGIGKVYNSIKDISKSYMDASAMVYSRKDNEDFKIVDAINASFSNILHYNFVDENKIINSLKVGDVEKLEKLVDEIISTNNGISHEYMSMLFKELYNTAIRYIAEKGVEINEFILEHENNILGDKNILLSSNEEKREALLGFYKRIVENTISNKSKPKGDLASMIIEYVNKNYNKDLYLEKIAEEMGVSIKYISKVFKDKNGTNLSDYINTVRVAKIKELLIETEMPIGEISTEVGIFSRATFIRIFKKMEGITPSEFREHYRK